MNVRVTIKSQLRQKLMSDIKMNCGEKSADPAAKTPQSLGRRSENAQKIPIQIIVEHVVICTFQVNAHAIHSRGRGTRPHHRARQIAMYLAHVIGGVTLTEIGRLFRRDRTTVAHACHVTEDRRDDHQFDFLIRILEQNIRILARDCLAVGRFSSATQARND